MRDTEFDEQLRTLLEPERTSIQDAGFSQRVLAALPARRKRRWPPREAVIPGMTLAGCVLGLVVLPGGEVLRELLTQVPNAQPVSALPLSWLILVYVLSWAAVAAASEGRGRPTALSDTMADLDGL
jgi:hypothetical protein